MLNLTMILLLYLSLLCSLICGGAGKIEMSLDDAKVQGVFPRGNFAMRGFKQSTKTTYGSPDYPEYVKTFLAIVSRYNSESPECEKKRFSCDTIPDSVKEYLARIDQRDVEKLGSFETTPADTSTLATYTGSTKHLESNTKKFSAYMFKYNDPEWWKQWDMQDYRTTNIPVMDHNVVPVHDMGYTGNTITVALLGGGLKDHPDLGTSLDMDISFSYCDNDQRSYPKYWLKFGGYYYESEWNYHAGVIAMKPNNKICGVGIAPNVKIAAFKMTDCETSGGVNGNLHSSSLGGCLDKVDIYCNTWTVDDIWGKKVFPLSKDVERVFTKGISEGRNNLGAIYVFGSGRFREDNNCALNGYVNNPYTITIASAGQQGRPAYYSERCDAVLATAYSGDLANDGLVTIDANGKCAITPNNIPMGASVASGIIALLLESKPTLTYRDVMHIITMTAEVAPLADHPETWYRNGRGFWVSKEFGFGLLNAENMVNLAKTWKNVADKKTCVIRNKLDLPLTYKYKESQTVTIDATVCDGASSGIAYLEHVEIEVNANYTCRGAITISLTSPSGTESKILESRARDNSKDKFDDWNIMSTHYWGENPTGTWTVTIGAEDIPEVVNGRGNVYGFNLKLHGLEGVPDGYPRKYAAFRLRNGETNMYT